MKCYSRYQKISNQSFSDILLFVFLIEHYIDISKSCMNIEDMHVPLCHIKWQICVFMIDIVLNLNKFSHLLVCCMIHKSMGCAMEIPLCTLLRKLRIMQEVCNSISTVLDNFSVHLHIEFPPLSFVTYVAQELVASFVIGRRLHVCLGNVMGGCLLYIPQI